MPIEDTVSPNATKDMLMIERNPEYENCKQQFLAFANDFRFANRNEATTRLHAINELIKCLGWDTQKECIAEESQSKEYADYTLYCPKRMLIIEAKREGDYFELPAGKEKKEYSIRNLCSDYPNLKSAIEQVIGYAQQRGVPFVAVTNGHQVVALVAGRNDGVAPLDGRAAVFPTLQFMCDHFLDLWQCLSKPAIIEHRLYRRLIHEDVQFLPPKLSSTAVFS